MAWSLWIVSCIKFYKPINLLLNYYFFRQIPKQGNTAELVLSVLHRNFLGLDQFLGQTAIPLAEIDVYERPKSKYVYTQIKYIFFTSWQIVNS